ncbi:DnaJ C-terminal domain-containing protein [Amnibacterium flavum]|uniref:Molecular chaperone DnaJ n=1 Tax=Amnibacterium flavum TaxID=2173173 RepID=A0A2V1HS81_9MICO|nr:DnaJ C-terminal domain-containing protein [Amnibacterium flavum]PVZ95428.1 molecular chaperone DnaJ [Amnibacterium flavum]
MASQDWFDKDFYKVLGVSKDADESTLKKSYRKLARQFHPDSNPGNSAAEAKFKEISEAYSVLSDSQQRAEYDQMRAMGSGARFTAGGGGQAGGFEDVFGGMFGGGARPGGARPGGANSGDFDDIFSMFSGGGGGGRFGQGGFGQTSGGFRGFGGPTPGRDISATTTVDFITATKGDTVRLQGADGKPINVKIPAGVSDGQKIKLRGRGEPSPDGGEPGDLVLTVSVRKHPVFERDGNNLRITVPVTFPEAALGATIQVPTLGGDPVKLKVAPGTSSGKVLRVKDRGVSTSKGTGDLLARIEVAVPSRLNDAQREALKAFEAAGPTEDPRADLLFRAKATE